VPSMIVPPGFKRPSRSASSIILTAMRSLIELPGLNVSTLASTVAWTSPWVMRLMRTMGVSPMASRMLLQIFFIGSRSYPGSGCDMMRCMDDETTGETMNETGAEPWKAAKVVGTDEDAALIVGFLNNNGIEAQAESLHASEFPTDFGPLGE